MNNTFEIADAIHIIKEQLESGAKISFVPKGISMKPMLSGSDKVILEKPNGKLKKYDLPLYVYPNTNAYAIHRVISFDKQGNYIICGDNNITKEYGITDDNIIAIVTAYYKKGKLKSVNSLSYKIYCRYNNVRRYIRSIYGYLIKKLK